MIVRYILTVLATVVLMGLMHGQTTVEYTQTIRWNVYHNGQFHATASQGASIDLCLGETYEFIVGYSSGGFYSGTATDFFLLEEAYCNGGCINLDTPAPIVNFLGTSTTSVTYVEADPSLNRCYSSSEFKTTITADQSGNFDMSWQGVRNYRVPDEPNSCNPSLFPRTEIFNFSGSFYINVLSNYDPVLVAPTEVQPGQSFLVELINCAPGVSYSIEELCSRVGPPYNGSWFNCGNSANPGIKSFTAPNYTTDLQFKAYYRRNECQVIYDSTSMIFVRVVEQPVENACEDDPTIEEIEAMIVEQESLPEMERRTDYHSFATPRRRLETNCSIEEVWEAYLSSNSFAQPQVNDMPTEPTYYIPIPALDPRRIPDNPNLLPPTMQCEDYNITSISGFIGKFSIAVTLNTPLINSATELFDICPELKNVNPLMDPIKVVIDGNDLCLTRYTKQGHIFHKGKTTTCFEVDNCGDIYIVTRGKGITVCSDGDLVGEAIAKTNSDLGKKIFDSNHGRFTCFN